MSLVLEQKNCIGNKLTSRPMIYAQEYRTLLKVYLLRPAFGFVIPYAFAEVVVIVGASRRITRCRSGRTTGEDSCRMTDGGLIGEILGRKRPWPIQSRY
jgi:hypothetical protein